MGEELQGVLETIRSLTRKYRNIPLITAGSLGPMIDEIELIRKKVQRDLASVAAMEESDPEGFRAIGEALEEAREALVTAELYIQRECPEEIGLLGTIRPGMKSRGFCPPAV